MNGPARPRGFHLLDVAAIVVGYGMASLPIRAFWPRGEPPSPPEVAAIVLFYSWLGLAMSGPFVLLIRARGRPRGESRPDDDASPSPFDGARTWAEVAWLIIGFYWLGLTLLVVPARLHRSPLHDAALMGVFPIVAALVLRFLDRGSPRHLPGPDAFPWTHRAAIGLLVTWPIAWMALILLGKSLL